MADAEPPPEAPSAPSGALDAETDVRAHRSRLLVAIAAGNNTGLKEVLGSVPPHCAAALEAETRAAGVVAELAERLDAQSRDLVSERVANSELQKKLRDAQGAGAAAGDDAATDARKAQAEAAQLRAELQAARGHGPVSSEAELSAVALETRVNELQAVIVQLQTQLRQSEMRGQQATLEVAASKESVAPHLRAMRNVEDQLSHTQRLLHASESTNGTLLTQLAALQARSAGIASGETRPPLPARPNAARPTETLPEVPPPLASKGDPTVSEQASADADAARTRAALEAAAEAAAAAAEAEAPLPEGADELARELRLERSRVRLIDTELSQVRSEAEHQLERHRRGADRGLRELQSEVARLHRAAAELREALAAAEGRATGEAGFRRRAEQGWLSSQQNLERTQAELQEERKRLGESEGRLSAAGELGTDLSEARRQISVLQTAAAAADARMVELLEAQKLNSQHVAVAMGHAQQHAASEYERLQAEHTANHHQTAATAEFWRARCSKASTRSAQAAASLGATRSSLESLLSRLVTATSVADMADQSRLLFEVKAALIDVEETLRRPDSSGGPPRANGPSGGGADKRGGRATGSHPAHPTASVGGGFGGGHAASQPQLHLPGIGQFATAGGFGGGGSMFDPAAMYGGSPGFMGGGMPAGGGGGGAPPHKGPPGAKGPPARAPPGGVRVGAPPKPGRDNKSRGRGVSFS